MIKGSLFHDKNERKKNNDRRNFDKIVKPKIYLVIANFRILIG